MGRALGSERGAAGLLVIVFAMLAALCAAVVLAVVQAAVAAGRAQSGADAVALAVAMGSEAAPVAAANRVEVVAVVQRGNCVEVKVRHHRAIARARAHYDFPWADRPACR